MLDVDVILAALEIDVLGRAKDASEMDAVADARG